MSGHVRHAIALLLVTLPLGCREPAPPATTEPLAPPAPAPELVAREGSFVLEFDCAIVEGGRVWCGSSWLLPDAMPDGFGFVPDASEVERLWGFEGQLCMARAGQARCVSEPDPIDPPLPSDAAGFVVTPSGRAVRSLATDSGRQCVVDGEGVPWCRWLSWDDEAEQPPLRPYPLVDIAEVEMGDEVACMRATSGEIHCLFEPGMVDVPELDASLADLCAAKPSLPLCSEPLHERADWPAPFRVLERSRDLAVGASHACLVDERGTVGCMTTFALANHPLYGSTSEFAPIAGLPPIVQIDASDTHVCALAENGEVWCFGENERGQLGDGTTQAHVETTPVLAGRWPDALAVSAGFGKSCVHRPSETLCWGWIDERVEGPTQVPELRASELLAFEHTTCAITDAGWRCFGGLHDPLEGASGAARLREVDDPRGPSHECRLDAGHLSCPGDADAAPFELHDVIDAEQGLTDLCVLRPREVWCGFPDLPDIADPAFAVPASSAIDGDAFGGCVLDEQGKPHCWQDRGHALTSPTIEGRIVELAVTNLQCGLDAKGKVQCWAPERVTLPLPTIAEVTSSNDLACARDTQGGVWCWGLGDTQPIPPTAPLAMPVPASAQIVAGIDHTCSRSVAGEVHCWGAESDSQRGRIDPNLALRPTKVETFTPR